MKRNIATSKGEKGKLWYLVFVPFAEFMLFTKKLSYNWDSKKKVLYESNKNIPFCTMRCDICLIS